MSKNEQKTNEENNASILQSYIDTKQAHDLLFQWIEKQNSETYVRDHFYLNKMIKNYYGCIGFWFKTKAINPQEKPMDIIITVPGSNKVPEAVIELSKNDNFRKFEQEQKNYTPIVISEEEAEPRAYELLKKQYPNLFDEFGKLTEETELLGTFLVAIPIWEGTYNSKYGKEHKFYIDAQTGEVTGDLYNDKSKSNKKPTKRLTAKDLEKLNTNSAKTNITTKIEKEKTNNSESKKEEKIDSKKIQEPSKNTDNIEETKETEEERKRYILIALIVLAIAILLFIFSQILKPNHDPNKPNPQNTSITAQQKPKYTPPPKEKVEKAKIEKETPEKFVDSIIKKLISQKYKEINELISKNPDEVTEIEEGYTNITSMFRDLGQLEDYYSKTTSVFPEKTTKIFGKTEEKKEISENNLPDGSAIPDVIKEQAKAENELISVSTSYIETYKDTNSDENSPEKKDRTVLIFTLSTEDNKTKIKSVHRKYETVDDSAISQIIEKESNSSYSEISQKQPEEKKEEQKQKEENNNSNENIQQQPEKKADIPVSQKPHINLIPKGSTYVEDEPTKHEEKAIKKESIQQVETESTSNQTNSATTTNSTSSSSEGSDFGSAGGSVQ
ncbi:hypothetical protein IJJ97_00415 [bacterium]|nr:hypothetical protein [bacterium]